jgi:Holliday junction resolvase RusA-like endonuclease
MNTTRGEIRMLNTTFILSGNVPSKKNSRQVFVKNGRIINIPSKRYKEWHDECSDMLDGFGSLYPPYEITLTFWMKDKRRSDLDNKMASVLDLLQDLKIIEDDCWQKLRSIKAVVGGVSKDFPRVKVEIHSGLDKT